MLFQMMMMLKNSHQLSCVLLKCLHVVVLRQQLWLDFCSIIQIIKRACKKCTNIGLRRKQENGVYSPTLETHSMVHTALQVAACELIVNLELYCKGNPVVLRKSLSLAGRNPKMNISGYNTWKYE